MESKKDEMGPLNLKKVAMIPILPSIIGFLVWVGASIKKDPQQAIGMIILAIVAGLIGLFLYYVIAGGTILIKDVIVVEARKSWVDFHTNDKDKKK